MRHLTEISCHTHSLPRPLTIYHHLGMALFPPRQAATLTPHPDWPLPGRNLAFFCLALLPPAGTALFPHHLKDYPDFPLLPSPTVVTSTLVENVGVREEEGPSASIMFLCHVGCGPLVVWVQDLMGPAGQQPWPSAVFPGGQPSPNG